MSHLDFPTCPIDACNIGLPHRHGTDGPMAIAPVGGGSGSRLLPIPSDSEFAAVVVEAPADVIAREHRVMHTSHAAEIVCLCGQTFTSTTGLHAIPISAASRYGKHLSLMREQYDSGEGF